MTTSRSMSRWAALGAGLVLAVAACGGEVTDPPSDDGDSGGTAVLEPAVSGYLAGSGNDQVRDVAVDGQGNLFVTGGTTSSDFPVTAGAYQTEHNPGNPESGAIETFDVFVTRLSPDGAVVWSTFLGGPNYDRAYALEVDDEGYVYVAGRGGRGFPVTPGAFQTEFRGGEGAAFYGHQDGFVCKLTPDGAAVVFCSYFGTTDPLIVRDLAVDDDGTIYLVAARSSGRYPSSIESAFVNGPSGGQDAVVARVSADGSEVGWARYLGGGDWESNENSVRLDGSGNPYVLLTTRSTDMETTAGVYQTSHAGDDDLYVARISPTTGSLVWGTYIGASGNESTETHELAVSPSGHVYTASATKSEDFPTTEGAVQREYGGGFNDIAVVHLDPSGGLVASTLLGGGAADRSEGVDVDASGNVYFTGVTGSSDFPVTADAFRSGSPGEREAIAVALSPGLDSLLYSTVLGGGSEDEGRCAAFGAPDNFLLGGISRSGDWPRFGGAPGQAGAGIDGVFSVFRIPGGR